MKDSKGHSDCLVPSSPRSWPKLAIKCFNAELFGGNETYSFIHHRQRVDAIEAGTIYPLSVPEQNL